MPASTVETNTSLSFLMYDEAAKGTYNKLTNISDYPDMGSDPEALEVTNLTDTMQRFIKGIKASGSLAFNAYYIKSEYQKLAALEGKTILYALWFGGTVAEGGAVTPTGDDGKLSFTGQLSVRITGGGTNEPRKMAISIMPNSAITFA